MAEPLRGDAPGPLLWPIHRSGRVGPPRRLSAQAVLYLVRRRADAADVSSFSPHDLRRSFISDLLDAGVDLNTVQQTGRPLAGPDHRVLRPSQ